MEEKVINFLFEKGYLNMDKIIEDWVNNRTDFTTYTLLKTVEEVMKYELEKQKQKQPKSRGCCSECGEGYDNEEEWLYNIECKLCGHPIPEHLIVKRP